MKTRRSRRIPAGVLLTLLLAGALLAGTGFGAMHIAPGKILAILARAAGLASLTEAVSAQEAVLLSIRIPRVLLGVLVGGSLALAGAAMQALFRNPLADPGLLGVSSGAALAAFAVFVFGNVLVPGLPEAGRAYLLPAAAFAGGLCAIGAIQILSREGGRVRVPTMLMAGIAINALCGAGIGLFAFLASDAQLRGFTFWSLGSLGGATWGTVGRVALCVLPAALYLVRLARPLNLMSLGETEAAHLGVPVERVKASVAILCALVVGAGVSATGAIGFIGLVVPHLMRLMLGPDNRLLFPASMLAGASLLVYADTVARTVAAPAELPVGILTALVGGPFFLYLLVRSRELRAWT